MTEPHELSGAAVSSLQILFLRAYNSSLGGGGCVWWIWVYGRAVWAVVRGLPVRRQTQLSVWSPVISEPVILAAS